MQLFPSEAWRIAVERELALRSWGLRPQPTLWSSVSCLYVAGVCGRNVRSCVAERAAVGYVADRSQAGQQDKTRR